MALVSPLSRARPLLRTARLFSATALLALTSPSANIGGVHRGAGGGLDPDVHNIKYDGRFTFARIRYVTGPGGYYYRGLPAWAHGYNMAESNLMKILREVTALRPHVDESNAIALDDPELLKYPIAYMTEAGFWTMTDREAAGLRELHFVIQRFSLDDASATNLRRIFDAALSTSHLDGGNSFLK